MPHLMNCQHSGEGWCLKCVGVLEAEAASLREQKDKLVRALKKFGHQAYIIDENTKAEHNPAHPDCSMFHYRGSYTAICLGDCRHATQVIREIEGEGKQQ